MTLQDRVRDLLRARRAAMSPPWSVSDLARAMGVPRSTLSSALHRGVGPGGVQPTDAPVAARTGAEPAPPAVSLPRLAAALGVDGGELVGVHPPADSAPDNGAW